MNSAGRRIRWVGLCGLLTASLLALAACRSMHEPEPQAQAQAEPAPSPQFEPLSYVAAIQQGDGRYPNLYAPTSFAVWIGPEVSALKRQEAAKDGQPIEPWFDNAATVIPGSYIVIECHMDSAFSDSSIAYDAVGFRGLDVYFELPDGRRVKPIQVLVDPHARESTQGTLKAFSRTNLLVFPREDLLLHETTIPAGAPSVSLVLDGVGSRFHFDWQGTGVPRTNKWAPAAREAAQAVQLGFRDLYGRLKTLAHIFD